MVKIHKEGFGVIFKSFLILFVFAIIIIYVMPFHVFTKVFFLFVEVTLFGFIIYFFRFIDFLPTENPDTILSSAYGLIVNIIEVPEEEVTGERFIQISVFMSPKDIHLNRFPISGNISTYKYHPGRFLLAFNPKSSTENERTTTVIEKPGKGKIVVRQIAGFVARRIKCYSKEGEIAVQGAHLGFIKFGSRVDHFIPVNAQIQVKLGQKVKAGQTVLATW